ncbi:synaptic vesicle glycoprotein 2A-like [Episyrphus balteatus]|uniref:synaptic vesicle glycoprotein 2A-like n=1 Tax=Episyrphus balteatus TaxID=286459 RepID=UPI002485033E|nr:synaptic vesicle glycoprotein 2A-like [Episyrphus balteatus]XP_055847646.1 synaptic vesicle glycoprotein 2A-like [Episyrphus balteatus]
MNDPKDFETAIEATGFGLFNLILLSVAIPSCLATVYETSTMSYILPSAECDLKLDLLDKGILNAITYAGMITSAIGWGFIADTKGRKKVLVFGFLADAVCAFGGALSQNLISLMIFKFLGGFSVCGPFAVLMSYMTEFHGTKYRARVMMVIGMLFSIATLLLPILAWIILPNTWDYSLFNGLFVIHSWKVFLAVCALPSLTAGIAYIFLPETPKFLMSQGRNEEALVVLQTIYSINCRKPKSTYPFDSLVEEAPQKINKEDIWTVEKSKGDSEPPANTSFHFLRKGIKQLKPMFSKKYLGYSLNIYTMQFCILLGLNTIRLWLPQLFTSIEEFKNMQALHGSEGANDLCAMIDYSVNKAATIITGSSDTCEVKISDKTYINTIIVGLSGLGGYFVAGGLINALGNKWILIIALTTSGVCGFSMYWTTSSLSTLIVSSIYVTVGSIGSTSLLGIIVNLFPTSLRTMIVSITMMFGRLGALIGNILFPYFMSLGCLPPFFMVGCVMFIAVALGCILPATHKTSLK